MEVRDPRMVPPRYIPAAGSGNKENISANGGTLLDRPALHKEGEVAFPAKVKKKPTGFNLRKSIAWNPAFFTEEGILDNSELSVLTGSELTTNGSSSSRFNGITSPVYRSGSGRYDNTSILQEVANKSHGKFSAKYSCVENQGRRLLSSARTPQRDKQKEHAETQNRNSARSFQKRIPRVPRSTQKKVSNSASTILMSRTPKMPHSSLPMSPRCSTSVTTVSKSNKKLPPVKTEHIHRVPGLLPKSKIDSGPSMKTDMVPTVAAIHKETNVSVKLRSPQISPSGFGDTALTLAKRSALRMPSPSVGFFTKENAQMSRGNHAEGNEGRFSAGDSSSPVKPPRYIQPEDLKIGLHLSKVLPTNCTTVSNLVSLPVTTDNNTNTLISEKRSLSKIISTYSKKSRDANYQERLEVYCSLAGSGATTQPLSSQKNNGSRNSVPSVSKDILRAEGRDIIKEIEPVENSLSLKATCLSTIEARCSSAKPTMGNKLALSCISSQSNDLSCQSNTDSGSIAASELEHSYVGEKALPVSLFEDESCTREIDYFQNSDSCDHHNIEFATSIGSMEYTMCADQMPPSGNEKPDLAVRKCILNASMYDEGESALSEEPNSDSGTEIEKNKASVVTDDPLLHLGCENNPSFQRTHCSPVKLEPPMTCVERQNVLSFKQNMEDKMVFGSNKLTRGGASHIEMDKAVARPRTNTILRDHLKKLVPFTEEWLAAMEACGEEVLEQKSGAVQNSPPDKTAPEPSPWSPVKRKAQDVGPFDCTKYSKSVRTSSDTP